MRKRLDQVLVDKSLAPSRSRARDAIRRGLVKVAGQEINKAGCTVDPTLEITVSETAGLGYVSRGALKLGAALDAFNFDPKGCVALDIGASTGGFTEVLLKHGAEKVFCVDVGHAQLHSRLHDDPRVVNLEGFDARKLTSMVIPKPVSALVADVSFISLQKVLPAALKLTCPGAWLVALIKPQFEVGPEGVGKDGVVRDDVLRLAAVTSVCAWLDAEPGWNVHDPIPSPIAGGSGNQEVLLGAHRDD